MRFSRCFQEASEYRYKDPARYKATLESLYREEIIRRRYLAHYIGIDEEKQQNTLNYYSRREAIIDWMVDWGWTTDPRNAALGLPTVIPMIPFLRQIELIEWVYNQYLNQQGGIIEKSREIGATWLFCFIFAREWRHEYGFSAGIGSRKLTLVDDKDNPKAIFHKIRTIISTQPKWWLPEWDEKKYDKIANIRNPVNGSTISGEGGDDIGRGDRRSMYFVDEAAYLEHPQKADAALSQTTQSQFDVSSANGPNYFYQKRQSGRVPVFPFSWRDDPRKDEQWHEHERSRLDPVIFAQEIDIDYNASVENVFIPLEYIEAAVDIDLPDWGTCSAGLDVAAGGRNKSSLAIKHGCRVSVTNWDFKNGVDLTFKAIEVCNSEGVDYMNYDPLGVGHSFHSTIERTTIPMGFEYFPMNAGGETSDIFYEEFGRQAVDIFVNAKSEWWYRCYLLFKNTWEYKTQGIMHDPSEMISIENDGELKQQLCTPKKIYKTNGKFMVESKDMLRARDVISLDKADSLILSTIQKDTAFKRVWPTYKRHHFRDTKIDFKNIDVPFSQIIVILYYDKDSGLYGNCFFWGRKTRALRVYAEIFHPNPIVEVVANDIREKAEVPLETQNSFNPHVEKIFGNEAMFGKGSNDWHYALRKRGRIKINRMAKYDEAASILIARSMMAHHQIIVDNTLAKTNVQYKNWRIVENKPEDGYPFCRILCMAVSELRERGELASDEPKFRKPYSRSKQRIRERLQSRENPYLSGVGSRGVFSRSTKSEYDYLAK